MKTYTIREIQANDNEQIAKIIREVLIEFGVPKVGTAYEDTALDIMFETYNIPDAAYYVITDDSNIIGGAGIMQLQNTTEKICELQKMYFSPIARGKGFGSKIMETCLEKARQLGFEKCYLETLPYMKNARKLYHKVGFESLNAPLGDTGHYSCNMWMLKDLKK
ncbi:GNAT family N-acetyltransferase [Urechidicola croceus]|uniref:GNAT family N-acetyltransferase n=1 Tax=Urechidicola croceus TaxID=1850246 RepID=UPI0018D33F44|nr:GNAT family N-acetyltransferase [Urechidicola croceus]